MRAGAIRREGETRIGRDPVLLQAVLEAVGVGRSGPKVRVLEDVVRQIAEVLDALVPEPRDDAHVAEPVARGMRKRDGRELLGFALDVVVPGGATIGEFGSYVTVIGIWNDAACDDRSAVRKLRFGRLSVKWRYSLPIPDAS